jgi:hypothetical protein
MPRRWLLLCLPILLLAAGVLNAEGNPWDVGRFYAGGLCAYATVLGEFTGDLYLSDGYQLLTVPEVGGGWGAGGLVGYRHRRVSIDASYARSAHSGTWNDTIELESRLEVFGLSVRIFRVRLLFLEPFALLGCSGVTLTVFDGSTDGSTTCDETFWGLGLNAGGGISLSLGNRVSVIAQAIYRWDRFNTVDDFYGANVTITDGLDASGYEIDAMLLIAF